MGYDALVVGSGVAGMESALKLGDMGYKVLVIEEGPSIGGKMILLSKVFPTLDCASCISTPKMAATAHHPNVTVVTEAQLSRVARDGDGSFRVGLLKKPRFVNLSACTGCRQCEQACTVSVPDQFNGDMVARRAAYIPFPQAVPLKAVIDRAGTSPCTFGCPAGVKAHGYVSLIRSGLYEEAFNLVLEATPLAATLGRACYAPCEGECSRGSLEGPLPIRKLKRFVADAHYSHEERPPIDRPTPNGKRVAVVGSGPAGVTAAWQLAKRGYAVKIFEAAPVAGGAMRLSIPSYRLPAAAVEWDLANLSEIGVEIATGCRVDNLEQLKGDGFDAVLVSTGTTRSMKLGVPGEDTLAGISSALDFLRDTKLDKAPDLGGKAVAVIGGGNVAIDAARSARRLGASQVHLVCLEGRDEMPAYAWEVDEAAFEGVEVHNGWGVVSFTGKSAVATVQLKQCTSVFDADGRFNPTYDDAVRSELRCDAAIVAIGMGADISAFPALAADGARRLEAAAATFETKVPGVFAAGDAVMGPTTIARAAGHGAQAAYLIDRYLSGLELKGPVGPLPAVDKDQVLSRQRRYSRRDPLTASIPLEPSPSNFNETEAPISEDEARTAVSRCLDCGVCSECHQCLAACPADAIDLDMRAEEEELHVGTVIISTGYSLFPADAKPQYGYGEFPNVITAMQMDRLLAPTRPYNTVLRPSDGKVPERVAYVMCTGSRDQTVGNPLCSKFCCMYSLKQNQLILGALPLADVTVHYIDIRAAGKGYDEFFEQAKAMGTTFLKGRVSGITETEAHNLVLRYEDIGNGGGAKEAEYDLVVLAVGVQPNAEAARLFAPGELTLDAYGYMAEVDEDTEPAATSIPGVFLAGSASGPKDIPESILHAGAAVVQAAAYLERRGALA